MASGDRTIRSPLEHLPPGVISGCLPLLINRLTCDRNLTCNSGESDNGRNEGSDGSGPWTLQIVPNPSTVPRLVSRVEGDSDAGTSDERQNDQCEPPHSRKLVVLLWVPGYGIHLGLRSNRDTTQLDLTPCAHRSRPGSSIDATAEPGFCPTVDHACTASPG